MSETQTQEAPDDVRSALTAAFAEHEVSDAPEQEAPRQQSDDASEQAAADRARDERGRFARNEAQEVEQAEATDATATDQPATPDGEFHKATAMWPLADREMASKLPKEARDFLLRREQQTNADYSRKMKPLAEMRQKYEPLEAIFAPHQAELQRKGLTIPSMVQAWANVEQALLHPQSAPQMVADIIRGYNVDPRHVLQMMGVQQPDGAPPQPMPQQQAAVSPEIMRELQALKGWRQTQEQQQRASEEARIVQEVQSFATATDSAGALRHPYFTDVEAEMTQLAKLEMDQGRRPDLSKIYETAVWMNTSIRDRVLSDRAASSDAQRTAEQKRRDEEARAKAGRARRAASSVTGSPGPARSNGNADGSVRSYLEEAVAAATA